MDIYNILKLRSDASQEEVKSKYYKMLVILHPRSKDTGDEKAFRELQNAYKRYLLGEDCLNCFMVCDNRKGVVQCRCGGSYLIEPCTIGRIDCEYCSCFIFVEESPKELE